MPGITNQGDRVAVVTGGAGAIGGAIVARLAPDHTVVVLDRTGDVAVYLGDPDDVRRAAKLVYRRVNEIEISPGCSGPRWRLARNQPEVAYGSTFPSSGPAFLQ
jgi:NAD(P)-dependent dehydrogenase (short-subunit alcohol dehydrogenase family)